MAFLTHYFPPEIGAAQTRIRALAQGLAERGMEVTVHTGFPHYPDGVVLPPHRLKRLAVEEDGPVRVVRTWVYATPNRGTVRRLAGHASLGATAIAHAHRSGPVDVVVAESPPLFTAAAAVGFARRLRAPLILNCSDLWPESAIALGALNGRAPIAAAEGLERWCYRHAAMVTVPVEGMAVLTTARGATTEVIPPAVDIARFAVVPAVHPRSGAPLRVLYAGTLGLAQGLETVIEAARIAGPEAVSITFAGGGAEDVALRARAASLPNVTFAGSVPPDEIAALYAAHDLAVVPLRERRVLRDALPTKLFEAMAAGRGVVAPVPSGAVTDLLSTTGAGLPVVAEDAPALADAFTALCADRQRVTDLGSAGRHAATRFDRPAVVSHWASVIERVALTR